ncbi:uncharacterized protein C8orf76 isoform X1 [Erpetoichthys calabaricus]|uniref:Uncharacterized protein n=1 Tax=Erpetoichthys calabaricus TaxID=27687 RepID=A0A8C4SPH7_ERPCA|nr:uncharacterized protein C8orf76 isoform X1 [Erpetoichthys calabaricus]
MELFGTDFDDSFFITPPEKSWNAVTSYNAKFCEPEWFFEEMNAVDELERQKAFKFRGDQLYSKQDFKKALYEYSSCLALIPCKNVAVRRDVLEGMSRCLCQMGHFSEALVIADQLRKESTNSSHMTSVLDLEVFIYQRNGELTKMIPCLQQLITLHPYNASYWKKLGAAYKLSLNLNSTEDRRSLSGENRERKCDTDWYTHCECPKHPHLVNTEPTFSPHLFTEQCPLYHYSNETEKEATDENASDPQGDDNKMTAWLKMCLCFVRAKLLLQIVRVQQSSFILEINSRSQREIEEVLHNLQLSEEMFYKLAKKIETEFIPEKMKEDNQENDSPSFLSSLQEQTGAVFEKKWFETFKDVQV